MKMVHVDGESLNWCCRRVDRVEEVCCIELRTVIQREEKQAKKRRYNIGSVRKNNTSL